MTVEPDRGDGVSSPVTGVPPEQEFNIREKWEYARRLDALTELWIAAGPDWGSSMTVEPYNNPGLRLPVTRRDLSNRKPRRAT
jgi:hypothetical protein